MNEMYAAEQINIPSELGTVLKLLTKAAIREKPQSEADVHKWAANFFSAQCNRPASFDEHGKLTAAGREQTPHSAAFLQGVTQSSTGAAPQRQQQAQQRPAGNNNNNNASSPGANTSKSNTSAAAAADAATEEEEQKIVDALFDRYDTERTNLVSIDVLPQLILDLKEQLGLAFTEDQMQDFVAQMPTTPDGFVDLEEFRVAFFQG